MVKERQQKVNDRAESYRKMLETKCITSDDSVKEIYESVKSRRNNSQRNSSDAGNSDKELDIYSYPSDEVSKKKA